MLTLRPATAASPAGTPVGVPAGAIAADDIPYGLSAAPPASVTLYLEVWVNGQPTHTIVSFERSAGHVYIRGRDLTELGVKIPDGLAGPAQAERIDLDAMPGLTYAVDDGHQRIDLMLSDAIRAPYSIGRARSAPPTATSGMGLVFNYDAYAQHESATASTTSLAISSEQRLFSPLGVLSNTGIASIEGAEHSYLRESTSFQYDDPNSLITVVAGDTLSSSLNWTRAVRLGGVELSRNFTLRPDLVTFPIPQLGGSAALPSSVDLYVNNVRQLSTEVPGGPFVINGAAGITGAGMATLVIRDELGRAQSATLPIYLDTRLLAAGLSSFSIEGGMLRYDYGTKSFDYAGHPASSGTARYGLRDDLTLEAHAEATPELVDLGIGLLERLGQAGVLNVSVAATQNSLSASCAGCSPQVAAAAARADGHTGGQVAVGYQLISPRVSVTAQSTRALGGYADLATVGGTPAPRLLDQITVSMPLGHERTVGASFVHVEDSVAGRSALAGFWYSSRLSHSVWTFVNASHDMDQARSTSITLGLSMDFGHRAAGSVSAGSSGGHGQASVSASRSADYGGGFEWAAQSNRLDGAFDTLVRGGYLGRYGEVTAAAMDSGGHASESLEAVGGVVFMDGVFEAARRIGAGFALVSTDGVPGVPVMHENRPLGETDAGGHLLVPDLNAYEHNNLAIDTLGLPAAFKIPSSRLDVTPRGQSGVLARFPMGRYHAATVILVDGSGAVIPAGSTLHHRETGHDFVIGYDGMAFIDDLTPHNHLDIEAPGMTCAAAFDFNPEDAAAGTLANLGRIPCVAAPGDAP